MFALNIPENEMIKNTHILLTIIILSLLSTTSDAQRYGSKRYELVFGAGVSNVLSDLGGANQIGTHNSFKDLEFVTTKSAAFIGIRYSIQNHLKLRGDIAYLRISGADSLTKEPFRRNRNLSFRTPMVEVSAKVEYYLFYEHGGSRYNISGVRGLSGEHFNMYLFAGVGATWFNPRGYYKGKWHSLQPMGTEGQGLAGKPKYSRITPVIPFGLGFKYSLNSSWSLNLELSMRKTFTDYLDDVSGNYYDNDNIKLKNGKVAAHFADPTNNLIPGATQKGMQRGNPDQNDTYMSVTINVSYYFGS